MAPSTAGRASARAASCHNRWGRSAGCSTSAARRRGRRRRRPAPACSGCRPRPTGSSCLLLPDDVVVQVLVDLTRLGQVVEADLGALRQLFLDDLVAEIDALVADVDAGPGDQLLDLLLALPAERALQQVAPIPELCHVASP